MGSSPFIGSMNFFAKSLPIQIYNMTCRPSSVVERFHGKEEVASSILAGGSRAIIMWQTIDTVLSITPQKNPPVLLADYFVKESPSYRTATAGLFFVIITVKIVLVTSIFLAFTAI